jgi:hypothetical protein
VGSGEVSTPSEFLFPFEISNYRFYLTANGVERFDITSCFTRIAYKEISCTFKEAQKTELPKILRESVDTEDKIAYSYEHFYAIDVTLGYSLWYQLTIGILSVVVSAFTAAPVVSTLLFLVGKKHRNWAMLARKRLQERWDNILTFYVVFMFTYRSAFAPKWLTWIDISAGVGTMLWTLLATCYLLSPRQNQQ